MEVEIAGLVQAVFAAELDVAEDELGEMGGETVLVAL